MLTYNKNANSKFYLCEFCQQIELNIHLKIYQIILLSRIPVANLLLEELHPIQYQCNLFLGEENNHVHDTVTCEF